MSIAAIEKNESTFHFSDFEYKILTRRKQSSIFFEGWI